MDPLNSSLSMNLEVMREVTLLFPDLKNIARINMSSLCSTIYQGILVSIVFHQTPRYSRYRLIRTNTVINSLTVEIFVRLTWSVGNLYRLKINIRIVSTRKGRGFLTNKLTATKMKENKMAMILFLCLYTFYFLPFIFIIIIVIFFFLIKQNAT